MSLVLGRRGKSFSYGKGAGGGSHLADQEASGKVSRTAWAREVACTATAVAQKPRAVSAPHCDTMYPASFGVTRRGSASKGKGIAAACAVEKERDSDQAQMSQRGAAPRPKESSKQKKET